MDLHAAKVWEILEARGKAAFLITPQQTFSYADLREAIRRWLGLFDRAALQSGDRVLIRTQNEFAMVSAFLATILDGKVAVALTGDTPISRRDAVANFAEAHCIIDDEEEATPFRNGHYFTLGSEDAGATGGGFLAKLRGNRPSAIKGLPKEPAKRSPSLNAAKDDLAYLLFTSGTTGEPAGVMITHGNLFANLSTLSRLFEYEASSRIFNDMALAHADGIVQGPLLAVANGCALIRAGGFSISGLEEWLGQIRKHRATHAIMVPTIWSMIDSYAAHDDYFDAPEMRSLQSVAAKLDLDLWRRIEKRFGLPLASHYGLTETVTSALYAGVGPGMGPIGGLGLPIDCEARIDPGADGAGELQLRGDNVFSGYWRNEERTAASFTHDGWMRTGDLAERKDDTSYAILGRLKNIIMSGGFLIRPEEIDEVMLRHSAVRESVTVALDDEMFGEIPGTAIALKDAQTPCSPQELIEHARAQLEPRKVPKHCVVLEAIPRGLSGKAEIAKVQAALAQLIDGPESDSPTNADTADIETKVLELAARTFRADIAALSMDMGPGDIAGWDSFSHLSLILEAERQFDIRLPASKIAQITKLADLVTALRELS